MEEKIIVNGYEYTVYVTENEQIAREITNQKYAGYELKHLTSGYLTKFYKVIGNEKKEIGQLYYDPDTCKYHLFKYLNPKIHIMQKTGEVGVNGALFAKLRVGDYIHFTIGKKKYKIRVEKAAKVGNYKNFSVTGYNSELQYFIPMSELTEIETKKRIASRGRSGAKTRLTRATKDTTKTTKRKRA